MNEQTFLPLPALADASPTTIAILGSGTAVRQLHAMGWLQQADMIYEAILMLPALPFSMPKSSAPSAFSSTKVGYALNRSGFCSCTQTRK